MLKKATTHLIGEEAPSIKYTLTVSKDEQDWAGKISSRIGEQIFLRTFNCTATEYHGRVLFPSKYRTIVEKTLKELLKKKEVKKFEEEGKSHGYTSFVIVAPEPRVCYRIIQNKFELLSPVIVDSKTETYSIGDFDRSNANKHLISLTNSLDKAGIQIEGLDIEVTEPDIYSIVPDSKFDETDLKVINLLARGNYFDEKKRKITQNQISTKLGISVGKVNDVIRYIERIGFTSLLSSHPDLKKFKKTLRTIIREEEESLKT